MSEMTPQHPAAPETETDANGLTEAEVSALSRARRRGLVGEVVAVERIVAERVRVVEGERDAARTLRTQRDLLASAMWDSRKGFGFDTDGDSGYHTQDFGFISESFRRDMAEVRQEILDLNAEVIAAEDRAESAEAAHEAEKAAHERLRRRLRALAKDLAARAERQHAVGDEPGRSAADRHRFNGEGTGLGIAHMLVAELLAGDPR